MFLRSYPVPLPVLVWVRWALVTLSCIRFGYLKKKKSQYVQLPFNWHNGGYWVSCRFKAKLPNSSLAIMQLLRFEMEVFRQEVIWGQCCCYPIPQDEVPFYVLAFQMLKSYFVLRRIVVTPASVERPTKRPSSWRVPRVDCLLQPRGLPTVATQEFRICHAPQ